MGSSTRANLAASLIGGLVVAAAFVGFGLVGHRTTRTVIDEAPIAGTPVHGVSAGLTAHDIYVHDAPGVVFIKALIIQQVQNPFDLFPERVQNSSTGSGFLISRTGLILTNYHVIEGADPHTGITVQFEDNIARRAIVVGDDENDDLALLKVDMAGVASVRPLKLLSNSAAVQVGDPTLAIGNPFGLDRTLTTGIVSALQRQIEAPNGFTISNVIQTDAPINPGNSGGPLLNAAGQVIGVNSQIASGQNGQDSVGIAFAVPSATAYDFAQQYEHDGRLVAAPGS
jgi:S1-C subfamily serine protease